MLSALSMSILTFSCDEETPIDEPPGGETMEEYEDTLITNFDPLNDEEIRFLGRYEKRVVRGKDSIYLGFTATGFELFVDVKEENNTITSTFFSELLGGNQTQYIKPFIDGVAQDTIELTSGEQEVTLYENLSVGTHTLKVLKLNEASVSRLALYDINIEGSIDVYKRTYNVPRKKIEFYGDSITCGYGNLGNPDIKIFRTIDEDGSQSYAQLLADKLDYDPTFVSCSGIALSEILAPYGVDMMDQYDTVDGEVKYDMSKVSPDIVIMNLGSNDDGGYNALDSAKRSEGIEEFINNYSIIIDTIMENNPNCKVISCYNMCYSINIAIIRAIREATSNINEKYGEGTAYSIQFSNNQSGSNGHPALIAHEIAANTLYDFIVENELNK